MSGKMGILSPFKNEKLKLSSRLVLWKGLRWAIEFLVCTPFINGEVG